MASDTLSGLLQGKAALCKSEGLTENYHFSWGLGGLKVALCKSEVMIENDHLGGGGVTWQILTLTFGTRSEWGASI